MIKASAPGKLVLLGEYGVLTSGVALVMAVNRRVHVTIEAVGGNELKLSVPPLMSDSISVPIDNLSWQLSPRLAEYKHLSLITSVIDALQFQAVLPLSSLRGQHITVDSRALFEGNNKLGLGSSAAVTVALTGALFSLADSSESPTLETLLALHRSFQGSGSGLDIACSFHGGVIGFQRNGNSGVAIESLRLPQEIEFSPIWSGHSANTNTFLQALEVFAKHNPTGYDNIFDRLKHESALGIQRVREGDGQGFVASVGEFGAVLKGLGEAAQLPIFSREHRDIESLMGQSGVVYKTCGAGGGDLGIALSLDARLLAQAVLALQGSPFRVIPMCQDNQGLLRHG